MDANVPPVEQPEAAAAPSAVEVVTAFFDAYRAHDVEGMVELCAETADFHYVPIERWGRQRVVYAHGQVRTIGKTFWVAMIDTFPDLTNKVEYITADEKGSVAAQVVVSGTQAKPFGPIENQGRHCDLAQAFIFRVNADGFIEEVSAYWDCADWFAQLGTFEVD